MCTLDPITTQVISSLVLSVSEEVGATLMRTAYSSNIKDRADFSTAIFDSKGQVIAQAQRIPMHLGSMLGTVQELIRRHPIGSLKEGDMFIANDPYGGGGTHLPDYNVIAPVFYSGELVAYVANIAHHSDVGGMVAGSESGDCTSIFQEGLRMPMVRLVNAGEVVQDILDVIVLNTRTPQDRLGDIRAQLAANRVGMRRMVEVCQRYGADLLAASMAELLNYGEKRIRACIERMPDGAYRVTDYLDSDGVTGRPVTIKLSMLVEGDKLRFDFSGTDPQVGSSRNVPINALKATVYTLIKIMIDPGLPANSGYYRAVDVKAPEGSLLNPLPPAAVGVRTLTCGVVSDMIADAISQAVPQRAMAGSAANTQIIPSGMDPWRSKFFVDYESFGGGLGARPYKDGLDVVKATVSGSSNLPVESMESNCPLLVERYELLADSGGPGRFRGGLGARRDYRILVDGLLLSVFGERQRNPPPSLAGGIPGRCGRFILNPDQPGERVLPSMASGVPLAKGDLLRVEPPGGGGYGDPRSRDPEMVLHDLIQGKISPEAAEKTYCVVVRNGAVDIEATSRLRSDPSVASQAE